MSVAVVNREGYRGCREREGQDEDREFIKEWRKDKPAAGGVPSVGQGGQGTPVRSIVMPSLTLCRERHGGRQKRRSELREARGESA